MPRGSGSTWGAAHTQKSPVDLAALVDHRECVQVGQTVTQVSDGFRHHTHEFAAVVRGETYVGLISRGQIGNLLGTRFGFPLHSHNPIQEQLLPDTLCVTPAMPLMELLGKAMSRTGEAFYQDIPLVEADGRYVGIIAVPSLVRAQSSLVNEQFALAGLQRRELERKNQDLVQSLQQLRQSEGRYETLFQHSPLALALLNLEGGIQAENSKFQALLAPRGGVSPGNLTELMAPRERAAFLALLQLHHTGVIQPGDRVDEFELLLSGAEARLFRFHLSLVEETGQICAILEDITGQRAVERRLALHDKAALFESLAGGIAHELNNKLAPVLGFSELLLSRLELQAGSQVLQTYCQAITRSTQESVKIIRQLLQLSRPATMELQRTDLGAILEEAASIMRFRLKDAEVVLRLITPHGSTDIQADAAQIKQVVINLLINAVDAMEHSACRELEVRLQAREGRALVAVRDTGHGIPADKLRRIFDPFFTTKPVDRGTGLGLSVCLGIVQQHQGEITVSSTLGVGTVFELSLPLVQGLAEPRPHLEALRPRTLPEPTPSHQNLVDGMDVLVIDDEDYITHLVHEMLGGRLGWRVERIHEGREAIARLEQASFDLVITDLRMPGLDGFAILGWIRDFRPALLSKVLVITGDGGSKTMEDELVGMGVPVLRKPFTPDELVTHCRGLLAVC